jgi:hypothetical protein
VASDTNEYTVNPAGLSMIYGMAGGDDALNHVAWAAVAREVNKALASTEARALAAERARVVGELKRRRAQGGPTSYDTEEASLAYTDALGEMIEWMEDAAAPRGTTTEEG